MSTLIAVASIWAIAAITPGPNFFITVHTAISKTRRLSFFTVLGVVTGTFIWAVSGFLGISIIFEISPLIYHTLKILGSFYLIYIGIVFFFRNQAENSARIRKDTPNAPSCFKMGLFTNLINPKTAAFMTSLFAATIPPNAPFDLGSLCVIVICAISALWYSIVASLLSYNRVQTAYQRCKLAIERIAGVIFIFFGIKLATTE